MVQDTTSQSGDDELPWAIYARLSRKKSSTTASGRPRRRADDASVQRQYQLCREYATEQGYALADEHVYIDNHRSAWKRKGALRPQWQQMMQAARDGYVRGILVWKFDRFTRSVRDMEDLIETAELHPLVIDGPTEHRLDLTTSAGIREARARTNAAADESNKLSDRAKAAFKDARANGDIVGSPRTFGYTYAGDPTPDPVEAPLVREAVRRILEGERRSKICREWNRQGIRTVRGSLWDVENLRKMVVLPIHGGVVTYHGKNASRLASPPILDAETFAAIQAWAATTRGGREPSEDYPLSGGPIRCEHCDRKMSGGTWRPKSGEVIRTYRCTKYRGEGCSQAIYADVAEAYARELALELLADPGIRRQIGARDLRQNAERARVMSEIAEVERLLTNLEIKLNSSQLIQSAYDAAKVTLDRRWTAAQAALGRLQPLDHGPGDVLPAEDMPRLYDELEPEEQRAMLTRLGVVIQVRRWQPGTKRQGVEAMRSRISPAVS